MSIVSRNISRNKNILGKNKIQFIFLILIMFLFFACSDSKTKSNLSEKEIIALKAAIDNEYKVEASYKKILEIFPNEKIFSEIYEVDNKYSSKLILLFEEHSLNVPKNEWNDIVLSYDSINEACEAGVEIEIEKIRLYEKLIVDITDENIVIVFQFLRDKSQNNNLPAFEKCVERESSKSNIDSLVQSCSDLCRIDSETYCLEEIELRFDNENLKKTYGTCRSFSKYNSKFLKCEKFCKRYGNEKGCRLEDGRLDENCDGE